MNLLYYLDMQAGKPKLTKDIVKDDTAVFLKTINNNPALKFSQIWYLYNDNNKTPHRSRMHAGHIVFPTYTATEHPILCNIMPGFPVRHQLQESTQTHVHRVGDVIQPSHLLSFASPPALNLSQHQGFSK